MQPWKRDERPGVYEYVNELGERDWRVVPVTLGPTWRLAPEGTPEKLVDPQGYLLPELTLGWQILKWIEENLLADDSDDDNPKPFKPTNEQKRFILWWYAIDENGEFLYNTGFLQRLKGHGKDPIGAVLAYVEFVGPCRFAGWAAVDMPQLGIEKGDPVAKTCPRAWVQIAAVSKQQTRNTSLLLNGIARPELAQKWAIDPGMQITYAEHGLRQIERVTSSPDTLEGNRGTFIIGNEPHLWRSNNNGIEMMEVIDRNLTKSKGGASRVLWISNAYEPSENSAAQQIREDWEQEQAGLAIDTGTLYDSLEAPEDAKMRPPKRHKDDPDPLPEEIVRYLTRILEAVRGDSVWLNIPRIIKAILKRRNRPSTMRRFYFNQVKGSEDKWLDSAAIAAAISQLAVEARDGAEFDPLRAGWLVMPDEPIVMFGDFSKSDDATGLVGCRLSDGYVFTIGVWQPPPKNRGKEARENWTVPRSEVDTRVREAFKRFKIVAFYGDPSHAKDDTEATSYWGTLFDEWHRDFKDKLQKSVWPVKTGPKTHSIRFDMASKLRQEIFTEAAGQFVEDMHHLNDIEDYEPTFQIDGHPAMVTHLRNAIPYLNEWGVSLMKENRESMRKIDLAVCAVGARMLRKFVLNAGEEEEETEQSGNVWW